MVEDLTGFRWETLGVPNLAMNSVPMPPEATNASTALLLEHSFLGYEMLAGGSDSYYATEPAFTVNPTTMVVLQQLAGLAARYVVEQDFSRDRVDRRLLSVVESEDRDEALLREQLADLHLRILGEDVGPHDDAVDESVKLWAAALDRSGDAQHAWTVTLTALLQDVRSIHY
jgi:hypothetical protein